MQNVRPDPVTPHAAYPGQDPAKPPAVIVSPEKPHIYFPDRFTQPAGSVHFYREDFSTISGSADLKRRSLLLFIHEMTHVWQRMRGKYKLLEPTLRGAAREKNDKYYIPWKEELPMDFAQYNHEQQAELVAFYFDAVELKTNTPRRNQYVSDAVSRFIDNPCHASLLPINAQKKI